MNLKTLEYVRFKYYEYIENINIKKSINQYNNLYIKKQNQINKTFLFSNKYKIKLYCISSNPLKIIKSFILYHFKIGFNEINLKTPYKRINFTKNELKFIKKNNKILNLYTFNFNEFNQTKMINDFFKKNFEESINFILDGDEFIFTNNKINLDRYRLSENNYSCCQINFYNNKNTKSKISNLIMRPKKFFSEKKLIFEKNFRKINELVSIKTLIFKNDCNLLITKGNHKIINKKKTRYLNNIFLLHAKLITFDDILLRINFEKNRIKKRKNHYESLTSKIFHKNITKKEMENLWRTNSYLNLKDSDKILDYSLKNILLNKNNN